MSNADGIAGEKEAYQTWLLPELISDRLIKNEGADNQRSGFQRQAPAAPEKKKTVDRRAMTEKGLADLTSEVTEQAFTEGRADGYNAGYSEGEKRAKEIAKTALEQQQHCLQQLIESITQPIENERGLLTQVFTELIAKIAQQLCLRELIMDNATITRVVEEAVAALPMGEKHIRLYVHPNDLSVLEAMPGFLDPQWQLHSDESVSLGGCRVVSENSLVDFTHSTRLEAILADGFDQFIRSEPGQAESNQDRSNSDGVVAGETEVLPTANSSPEISEPIKPTLDDADIKDDDL